MFGHQKKVVDHQSGPAKMDISDLFEAPFDRIGTPTKLFEEDDVEDIIQVCKTLEKRNNA